MSPENPLEQLAERSRKLAEMAQKFEENGVNAALVKQLRKEAEQLTKDAVAISESSNPEKSSTKSVKRDRQGKKIDWDDDGIPF